MIRFAALTLAQYLFLKDLCFSFRLCLICGIIQGLELRYIFSELVGIVLMQNLMSSHSVRAREPCSWAIASSDH